MKKENKKLAQQRKAQERAKAEQAAKMGKVVPFLVVAAFVAAIVIGAVIAGRSGKKTSETEAATSSAAVERRINRMPQLLIREKLRILPRAQKRMALMHRLTPPRSRAAGISPRIS